MSDITKLPKWAQAKFEKLQNERDLLAAFHRTQPVEPDIDAPVNGYVRGFTYNAHSVRVLHSISTSCHHSSNDLCSGPCAETTSQRPIRQYSTKLLAAKALRWAVEQDCAKKLAEVDKLIRRFEDE